MVYKLKDIGSYTDFLDQVQHHPFLMHGNEIQPSFDLMVGHSNFFTFCNGYTEEKLNHAIMVDLLSYDREFTHQFYYPNTNMFSHSNEMRNIAGYIMKLKQ